MGTIMSLPWSAVWGLESTEVQDWAGAALGKQQNCHTSLSSLPFPAIHLRSLVHPCGRRLRAAAYLPIRGADAGLRSG